MSFAAKALHFQRCAKRARDDESRWHFQETARLYEQLAKIVPDFPPRFPGGRVWQGTIYEKRAEECRTMAEYFKDPNTIAMMNRLADTYRAMALAADKMRAAE